MMMVMLFNHLISFFFYCDDDSIIVVVVVKSYIPTKVINHHIEHQISGYRIQNRQSYGNRSSFSIPHSMCERRSRLTLITHKVYV